MWSGAATVADPTANPTMTVIGGTVEQRVELARSAARTNLSRHCAGRGPPAR